jgi:hypothetical protein
MIQMTFASFLSLSTSSATLLTLTPACALGGSATFSTFQARRDVDAQLGRLQVVDRLLLRLHDVGQRGVARLVQAQVGGDDRRQLQRHGLQAAVDFAGHVGVAVAESRPSRRRCPAASRAAPASIWPVWLASSSIACLPRMTRPGFPCRPRLQQLGDRQRLQFDIGFTRMPRSAPMASAVRMVSWQLARAQRDGDDFGRLAGFLQADGFFDAISSNGFIDILTLAVRRRCRPLDADLDVVVDTRFTATRTFISRSISCLQALDLRLHDAQRTCGPAPRPRACRDRRRGRTGRSGCAPASHRSSYRPWCAGARARPWHWPRRPCRTRRRADRPWGPASRRPARSARLSPPRV